ncbi:MAG: sigma-70 family RNA polymerase sigma factor [Clostridia bacterium]|nr:sigma-70 family RNA polymerase sigma factor [Clostridia bacterium]
MISNSEANELFKKYRDTGDIDIRNKLVENYLYIAEILAKKFSGRGVEYDDLYQVASEALIAGVEKFDPDLGNQFTTYITPTVTGIIKNYFRDYSRAVRLPRRVYSVAARVREETNEYFKAHGVKPTVKQLSKSLGYSEELIMEALECRTPVSLDMRVRGDDGESDAPLYDIIADDSKTFEDFEDSESLKTEIKKLDATEQQVVALRFLQGKSQAEVGKILGVSQMFVSRAERKIVEKLKDALL